MIANPIPDRIDDLLGRRRIKRIKSIEDEWMYYESTQAALAMATAGHLDEANELLECLWKYKWPHSENVWLPDQSFEVLWFAANRRPDSAPFSLIPIDEIEIAHRKYLAHDSWSLLPTGAIDNFRYEIRPMPEARWETLTGLDLYNQTSRQHSYTTVKDC